MSRLSMHERSRLSGDFFMLVALAALAVAGPGFRCHCSTGPGRILDAHLAARADWKHHVAEGRAQEFSPLTHRFVLVVAYRDLAPDSEIRLRWRYLGGKSPRVFRRDLRLLDGSGRMLFGARKDKGVWPPGLYDVIVELDGRVVRRVSFSVSRRTSYRFVVGAEDTGSRQKRLRLGIPGGGRRLRLQLEALNPKSGAKCRVVWKRRDHGRWKFYEESELVPIRRTGLVAFEVPKPRGGYCPGLYRAEARIGDRLVARLDFELAGTTASAPRVRRDAGRQSPDAPIQSRAVPLQSAGSLSVR